MFDQPFCELGDAVDLIGDGAELFVEDDLVELLGLLLQRDLEVLLPEEFGVGEAGGEDSLVAGDDRCAAVGRVYIGGADEGGGELALTVGAGEIFLVGAHGELDHFARDFEEGGIEAAEQRHRPFGEAGIFDHQAFILEEMNAGRLGGDAGRVADDLLALARIGDDVAGAQLFQIIVGAADGDDAGMVEAVADRGGAGFYPGDLHFHDLVPEECDDALERADPADAFGGGGGFAPAHRLGPGKGADDRRDGFGEDGGGGAAGFLDDCVEYAVAFLELVLREAGLAEEAFERLGRRGRAGALGLLADGFCLGREIAGDEREAAGRGIGFDGLRREAGGGELLSEEACEIRLRLGLHAGRDFLGEELEEEISHLDPPLRGEVARASATEGCQPIRRGRYPSTTLRVVPLPSKGRIFEPGGHAAHPFFSIQAWQAPLARSRTRPI